MDADASQVPGCFPAAAACAAHRTTPSTRHLLRRDRERLRRRSGSQPWAPSPVPTAGSLSGEPGSCPAWFAAPTAARLQPLSPLKTLGLWSAGGRAGAARVRGGSRLFVVSARGALCPHPCLHLRTGAQRALGGPWHREPYLLFVRNHQLLL